MKFSVLLPTRNRLEYLRYAVETVLRQDYEDWEIIVSDNDSQDDIAGYVASLKDDRIRYFRTETFVPVTENWNNAMNKSIGDYVIMLGDDDGLMPGYFSTMLRTFEEFPDPDFVYTSAYFYAYPGVIPETPQGFLRQDRNHIFTENAPVWLDRARAERIAAGYLNFEMPVASNMQFSLVSRRKITEMARGGNFYQSPYPDFYATPALFLMSDRILICTLPLVAIGITPKSYGYFHFNQLAHKGIKFLKNEEQMPTSPEARAAMLPGTSYNDSWLIANDAFQNYFSAKKGMQPNYAKYRLLQIVHSFKKCYFDRAIPSSDLKPLVARMTFGEKIKYGTTFTLGFSFLRLIPAKLRSNTILWLRGLIGQHKFQEAPVVQRSFSNLIEVFEFFASKDVRTESNG